MRNGGHVSCSATDTVTRHERISICECGASGQGPHKKRTRQSHWNSARFAGDTGLSRWQYPGHRHPSALQHTERPQLARGRRSGHAILYQYQTSIRFGGVSILLNSTLRLRTVLSGYMCPSKIGTDVFPGSTQANEGKFRNKSSEKLT
jgi:hypothetical protein